MEYFIILILFIIGLFIPRIRYVVIRTIEAMIRDAISFVGILIVLGIIVLFMTILSSC